jgi:hypothetical protein
MLTQREFLAVATLCLVPLALLIIGHSLQLGGRVFAVIVCVVGVGCVAGAAAVGWRSK